MLARHLELLDVHRVNNMCIGSIYMDIGKYLEADSTKRDIARIQEYREYLEAGSAKRDIAGI